MNAFPPLPGCHVERIHQIDPSSLQLEARGVRGGARCPACGVWSEGGHASYQRRPADLPLLGRSVQIALHVRRFRCHNAACKRRTFAERLPGLIAAHARRTRPTGGSARRGGRGPGRRGGHSPAAGPGDAHERRHAFAAGAAATAAGRSHPRRLGVDDWSFKRGSTSGTILVDLETRRVVDLLPDRRTDTLAAWPRPRRRHVKVIARDRSTEFARGVELGAPHAVQVADRWHLLKNVREMLTRWLFGVYARLRRLSAVAAACPSRRGVRTRAFPRGRTAQAASAASRTCSLARYEEVRRRHQAGESLRAIKKITGLARATVRRFARAESFPERAVRAPGPSRLDPFISWLEERLAAGHVNASALYRQLRERGYTGGSRQVHKWVQTQRVAPAKTTPPCRRDLPPIPGQADAVPLASPRQLAWLLLQPMAKREAAQKATAAQIEEDKEMQEGRRVGTPLCDPRPGERRHAPPRPGARLAALTRWLGRAKTCGVPALQTFADGVTQSAEEPLYRGKISRRRG